MSKKAICIISNSRELFLSFRRALRLSFSGAEFYFYDTAIIEKCQLEAIESPRYKKAGVLLADFLYGSEESLIVCRFIKYLRIKKELQFPLVFCSFSGMNELLNRYDILTYGVDTENKKGSSLYCPIPIDLAILNELVSNAIPLSNGNYNLFFEKYSGRYNDLYKNSIIPLLDRFDQLFAVYDDDSWIKLVDQVNRLTDLIIGETPLTCHENIIHNGSSGLLSYHLKNEVLKLSKCEHLPKNTTEIRLLFQQWYRLVSEKSFE